IVKYEFHTYNSYVNTMFGHNNEIRISIQDLNLDFDKRRAVILYDMYLHYRTYCQILHERNESSFQLNSFLKGFVYSITIDCSRQNKSGIVDVRLEFEYKENVPANTTAYCLIIYDRVIEYSPMSNVIRKIT
ncbi:hypothetical protein ALC53_04773, partial [Atta colombica]